MPGKLIIRPLAAKLTRDTELFGQMDPYCKVTLGKQKIQGSVCYNGGKHPHWEDTLVLRRVNEPECNVEIKEKDWLLPDGTIGSCKINLREVETQKRVLKWFPVIYETKPAGQILIEASYEPDQSIPHENPSQNTVIRDQVQQPQSVVQVPNENLVRGERSRDKGQVIGGGYGGEIHGWIPFNDQNLQPQVQIQGLDPVSHQLNQPQNIPEGQGTHENYWAPSVFQDNNQPYKYPLFSPQEYQRFQEDQNENPPLTNYQTENQGYFQDYRARPIDAPSTQTIQHPGNLYTNEVLSHPQHHEKEEKGGYDPLQVIRGAWYKGGQ